MEGARERGVEFFPGRSQKSRNPIKLDHLHARERRVRIAAGDKPGRRCSDYHNSGNIRASFRANACLRVSAIHAASEMNSEKPPWMPIVDAGGSDRGWWEEGREGEGGSWSSLARREREPRCNLIARRFDFTIRGV